MKTLLSAFILGVGVSTFAAGPSAQDLLQASDRGRGGIREGITWNITLTTTEEGDTTVRGFRVKAKEHNAFVEALSPARNKGEVYLFNDRNMWFFKPSLKKPVAISSRQKLSGQAANGDIASTHYARDYTPTLEKTEVLGGEKMHVLLLKAKADNLTYDQIRYWISDKDKLAKKAEFLTLQGKAFKVASMEYDNRLRLGGKEFPFVSRLVIADAKFPENKSVIEYQAPKVEDHADSLFNVNRMSR
ncbi:MAG: outer membrane lipoprotein-sorting protein [Bdellovibrionaceae bacterium]|nr:outer membrane lipoprotein-sorting protein [Pseudobdellovibrionaceae bacterium]